MKKIIILIISICLLYSCGNRDENIVESNKKVNTCVDDNILLLFHYNYRTIKDICDYKQKVLNYVYEGKKIDIVKFYELVKLDRDLGKYVIDKVIKGNKSIELSELDKIQLYYIFKDIYFFEDKYIKTTLGIYIKDKYKNYYVYLDRLILAENLLVQIFDNSGEDYSETYDIGPGYLTYQELLYLETVFNLEVKRYDSINLVSEMTGAYKSFNSDKYRAQFIKIIKVIIKNTNDKFSKSHLEGLLYNIDKKNKLD